MKIHFSSSILAVFTILALASCAGEGSAPFNNDAFGISNKSDLYVVSGACYGGGVVVATGPANTVSRFDITTGKLKSIVVDYNLLAPGDSPVAVADYDKDRILVLVENTGGRRLDLVRKDGTGAATYLVNTTALNGVTRSFAVLSDLGVLVSKSTAIEKFNAAKSRVLQGANPFVNAPAGACATSTTLISSVAVHSTGKIVFTHAAASPNNKIATIASTGYAAGADCLGSQAAPVTTALPTRAMFHSTGKLLVSFGSTIAASNSIQSYDFNSSTGAISGAAAAYSDPSIVNGPSSMAEEPTTRDVFVGNATSTFNTIERFTFNGSTLTRIPGATFIAPSIYTRCVSDLKVIR